MEETSLVATNGFKPIGIFPGRKSRRVFSIKFEPYGASNRRMSGKTGNSTRNAALAVIVLFAIIGVAGASSAGIRISGIGTVLVLTAFFEAGIILVGQFTFQHRRTGMEDETEE